MLFKMSSLILAKFAGYIETPLLLEYLGYSMTIVHVRLYGVTFEWREPYTLFHFICLISIKQYQEPRKLRVHSVKLYLKIKNKKLIRNHPITSDTSKLPTAYPTSVGNNHSPISPVKPPISPSLKICRQTSSTNTPLQFCTSTTKPPSKTSTKSKETST